MDQTYQYSDLSEFPSRDARSPSPQARQDIEYDFDIMMQKKKEESSRKRRRKNIDIINDNDDIIAELVNQMKQAVEVSALFSRFLVKDFI